MTAVVLTGHGGIDMLHYREDVAVPSLAADEVLIRVAAAGINNTDINTRIGWYSKANSGGTGTGAAEGLDAISADDASWSGIPLQFPRIQGADCCGTIVAVGADVSADRIGERVLVRSVMTARDTDKPFMSWTFGSEMDGAFAQYAAAPADETVSIDSTWSDVELASIPCAYSTAENMLHRGDLGADRVLVTGASGGVGSAAIQLAKRRGAEVIALSSAAKADQVRALGADRVLDRNADLVAELGRDSIDYVVDLVGGPDWPSLLDIMRRGARYSVAGAIAGPIVELDLRTLYLKDLSFFGATYQEPVVFQNLIGYIERNEISPVISATYPLSDIHTAQEDFIAKKHTGKLVLVP
ncbi:MAG: alcohol dehydrogenase family protein [Rhodospirillales bacterium]|nr:alcohol dehydrogenase family protein [Rhodospirillales bacterium]